LTRRGKVLWLGAAIALSGLGAVRTINACRCVEPSLPEAYRAADAVVLAKVQRLEPRPELGGSAIFLFVESAWKGEVDQELAITTGTDCLYSVEVERKYLLFLRRGAGRAFTTGRCMGDRPLEGGEQTLRWLEQSGKQVPVIPPTCHSCHAGVP
jgi:hypothetical protein